MKRPIREFIKEHCIRRKVDSCDIIGPGKARTAKLQQEKRLLIRALYRDGYGTMRIAEVLRTAHSNVSKQTIGLKRRGKVLIGTNKGDA